MLVVYKKYPYELAAEVSLEVVVYRGGEGMKPFERTTVTRFPLK
jgi:hypothetical protein